MGSTLSDGSGKFLRRGGGSAGGPASKVDEHAHVILEVELVGETKRVVICALGTLERVAVRRVGVLVVRLVAVLRGREHLWHLIEGVSFAP